ncbi:MAG: S41 family peptidase [Alphaproteobacteria bacterium]|nr:S41 family peptidase [Alphaproteobacteria bacterium]
MNTLLHTSRARWALPAASLILLVAACAGPREYSRSDTPYALPAAAARFFTTTYDQVAEKYVQPITLPEIAFTGIGNLRKLDPALTLSRREAEIELFYDGQTVGTFAAPSRNEAALWSQLTVAVVERGREHSAKLREAETEAIYQSVVEGVIKQLDTYSRYSGREAARETRAARDGFGGIGITLDTKEGAVRVANVLEETPAARGGLKVDDIIVNIDGQPTTGLEVRDIVRRLRGAIGARVNLIVNRPGDTNPLEIALTRALIVPPSVTYRRDGNTAVLRVLSFNQRTTDSLSENIRRATREIGPDLQGVVLDLRGNLGGLLDQAISVADIFLAGGQIVATRGRHRSSGQTSFASRGDLGENLPLVVLVNGSSASASEIVAAALQDHGRAVVVGTTTFGKGTVQTVIPMPNEGELILTWARFHAPSGYPIADLGVMPAICTSGNGSAQSLLDGVRDGRLTPASTMVEWRSADHSDMARMKHLRTICAPESKERDADMEVARGLLADKMLYARALDAVTLTAKAR